MILTGTGIIDSASSTLTPLLDTYGSAIYAYSLRQLRTAYTGPCIKVRRTSPPQELDFYLVDGYLNLFALATFIGSGSGFVTTWYDQSGNGRHMTQTTASNQPRITFNGVNETSNGKVCLEFGDGSTDWWFDIPNGLNGVSTISLFATWTLTDGPSNGGVFGPNTTGTAGQGLELIQQTTKPTTMRVNGVERTTGSTAPSRLWNSGSQTITTILGNSTSVSALKNNASVTLSDSSALPSLNAAGILAFGRYYSAISYNMNGKAQEFIVWGTNQTSNSGSINNNINTFYGTY